VCPNELIMKIVHISVLVASTLPLHVVSLLVRPQETAPEVPQIACQDDDSAEDPQSSYDKAYLQAYYQAAAIKLSKVHNGLERLRKLDSNGNGVLDCDELAEVKQQLDSSEEKPAEALDDNARDGNDSTSEQDSEVETQEKDVAESSDNTVQMSQEDVSMVKEDAGDIISRQRSDQCKPTCTWKCETRTCDQVCKPKCQTPQCQTRCTGMSTTGCQMNCGKPRCHSVCAPGPCAKKDCPACQTQCSKPMCKLMCPRGTQNCRDVCESPACTWECSKPKACPKPECTMSCDSPRSCKESSYKALPDLKDGEVVVGDFAMPLKAASLQQQKGLLTRITLPVTVKRAVAVHGTGELRLEESKVRLPVVMDGK